MDRIILTIVDGATAVGIAFYILCVCAAAGVRSYRKISKGD